jgi:hypothetical protein
MVILKRLFNFFWVDSDYGDFPGGDSDYGEED